MGMGFELLWCAIQKREEERRLELARNYELTEKKEACRYICKYGYGVCALCHKKVALTNKSTLRKHMCYR